jgi:hypothetical protein
VLSDRCRRSGIVGCVSPGNLWVPWAPGFIIWRQGWAVGATVVQGSRHYASSGTNFVCEKYLELSEPLVCSRAKIESERSGNLSKERALNNRRENRQKKAPLLQNHVEIKAARTHQIDSSCRRMPGLGGIHTASRKRICLSKLEPTNRTCWSVECPRSFQGRYGKTGEAAPTQLVKAEGL